MEFKLIPASRRRSWQPTAWSSMTKRDSLYTGYPRTVDTTTTLTYRSGDPQTTKSERDRNMAILIHSGPDDAKLGKLAAKLPVPMSKRRLCVAIIRRVLQMEPEAVHRFLGETHAR